ncbi:MAG TPA: cupredoxin domain-containing protein, partial [Dehalococcoidia bacterium]|nr:cupredoxin domain-containing protein [Dehalococcoidia bacterium]
MGLDQIVVTLGGIVLVAALAWYFFGPKAARQAELRGGAQEVRVTVKGGYSPNYIRVQQGVPLRLIFDRQEGGECTSRVVFPDFGLNRSLPAFATTTVEFTPEKSGTFGFACGMNMVHGTLLVEPSENGASHNGSAPASAAAPPASDGHAHETALAVGMGTQHDMGETAEVEFAVEGGGVSCPTCVTNIESILKDIHGVERVDANLGAGRVSVAFVPGEVSVDDLRQAIESSGYRVRQRPQPGSTATEDSEAAARRAEIRDLSRRLLVGAVLTAPVLFAVMVGDIFDPGWMPGLLMEDWFQLLLIVPVYVYTGWPIHRIGWLTLLHRTSDMNTLVTIGTTTAFVYSLVVTVAPDALPEDLRDVYYEAVGVILVLIVLGRLLEARAKAGTGEAIRKLIGLQARTARVVRDGREQEIP